MSAKKTDFELLQEALEENARIQKDLEAATALSDEAAKNLSAEKAAREKAEADLQTEKTAREGAEKEAKDQKDRADKAEGEVEKLKGEAKSAEDRAIEIAAKHGVKAVITPKENLSAKTGKELLEELNAITDPNQRTAFFRANRKAIEAAKSVGGQA